MKASMNTGQDTEQKPLRTGFGQTTMAHEVIAGGNLNGKTAGRARRQQEPLRSPALGD